MMLLTGNQRLDQTDMIHQRVRRVEFGPRFDKAIARPYFAV
jgi:hypothetical protein